MSDQERCEAINQLGRSVVEQRRVPGIAIAILRHGKLFQKLTLGSSNLATNQPVTGATPFQLASTTKLFSSAAVLTLVADERVRLDDPGGRYLEGLPKAWTAVTIRQLLSHTSGLPDITRRAGEIDLVAGSWESALPIIAGKPFQFRTSSGWAYTQTNYALLQRVVERVTGTPYEDYLDRRIFKPLRMQNTFFPSSQRACAVNYAPGAGDKIIERSDLTFPAFLHAAGGLCSSLDDLVLWSVALNAGKVIPLELLKQARSPAKLANGSDAKIGGPMSYGLGWAIDTTPRHPWAGHSGGNSTAFRYYLDDDITVIALHNGASDPDAIASSVAAFMLGNKVDSGQSALWDAAGAGDLGAATSALAAGADINALDTRSSRNGRYALNWAAINNRSDMIKFLLHHGAAIDAQNLTGFTALHHAAEGGSAEAATTLLEAGATVSLRNGSGETAADVARGNGHPTVARQIDGAAARPH